MGVKIMIKKAIDKAVNMIHLEEHEMAQVMEDIMEGKTTPAQIASLITALRIKGETVDEVVGAVKVMRSKAAKIALDGESLSDCINRRNNVIIDIVGTGGDGTMTFNISTAAAFVAAAGGAVVAKHGNRSVSSRCGSADVLEKLGVDIEVPPDAVAKQITEIGIAFMFAPVFHGSTRHAVGPRREIGIRTIFNMLGPLTNPASARHLLLGVYSEALCKMFADVLLKLGTERAMVVYGLDGMDEISVTADTKVAEIKNGGINHYFINPGDLGFELYNVGDLRGGDAQENAQILRGILSGKENGAKKAAVLINAGAAFYVAGIRGNIKEGIDYAREVIDSGKALKKLEELAGAGRG
jgi:anthranilate phosphoribosyltransferase